MTRRAGYGVAMVAMVRNSRGKQTRGQMCGWHDQINIPVRQK